MFDSLVRQEALAKAVLNFGKSQAVDTYKGGAHNTKMLHATILLALALFFSACTLS